MTAAEVALALFALCNSVRVFAYVPQIIAVARDTSGARAIAYSTWGLFAVSHLSTVAYAVLVINDWRMATIFVANTICCLVIVGVTAWKRALFRAAQQFLANSKSAALQGASDEELVGMSAPRLQYRIIAGGRDTGLEYAETPVQR